MPEIQVQHLLDRAQGSMPQGPGAPRQATLRRGVSDAYYALFHHLTDAVARHAVRNVESTAVRAYRRTISHAAIKGVSQAVASPKSQSGPVSLANAAKASADARSVAQAFVDLQQERHTADYDHDEVFDARRLQVAIRTAEQAIAEVDRLRTDPALCAYMSLLALTSNWSKGGR